MDKFIQNIRIVLFKSLTEIVPIGNGLKIKRFVVNFSSRKLLRSMHTERKGNKRRQISVIFYNFACDNVCEFFNILHAV